MHCQLINLVSRFLAGNNKLLLRVKRIKCYTERAGACPIRGFAAWKMQHLFLLQKTAAATETFCCKNLLQKYFINYVLKHDFRPFLAANYIFVQQNSELQKVLKLLQKPDNGTGARNLQHLFLLQKTAVATKFSTMPIKCFSRLFCFNCSFVQ